MKNINFDTTGSVTSTLVFGNQIVPDVYSFFAQAGEQIRLETSDTGVDTTIRVVGLTPPSISSMTMEAPVSHLASSSLPQMPEAMSLSCPASAAILAVAPTRSTSPGVLLRYKL
jgi:hypothetical protein